MNPYAMKTKDNRGRVMTKPEADKLIVPIRASRFYPHFRHKLTHIELKASHGMPLFKQEADTLRQVQTDMWKMQLESERVVV
jgi:hypothetical protein